MRPSEVVAQARALAAESDAPNLRFEVGDLFALKYDDATFDVVHAHQVLQHLVDPVAALVELRRVLRPEGVLAARDSDYGAFALGPGRPGARPLDRDLSGRHGAQRARRPDRPVAARPGPRGRIRRRHRVSSTTWTFADPESRQWWGGLWADRVRYSRFAEQAVAYGLSDIEELESIAQAFLNWAASPDGVFVVPHVEILARR